jgi:hypothetical protein
MKKHFQKFGWVDSVRAGRHFGWVDNDIDNDNDNDNNYRIFL